MISRRMAALIGACWLAAPVAAAQETAPGEDAPPAEEVSEIRRLEAARRAFDRGTAYALSEDYGRAAAQFETAYRLVPNPQALERAMQSHLRAEHALRAASLALRIVGAHPDSEGAAAAREVLEAHGGAYVQLELDCEACILAVDGRVRSFHRVMLEANTDHAVTVERGDTQRSHVVRGSPGEHLRLGPPAPNAVVHRVEERPPILEGDASPAQTSPEAGAQMPLPPWVFVVGAGLTVVSSALLLWSGIDTLAGVDDFNRMPTRPAFEEGEAKEARTNVLIAVTSSLAALSLVAAILTDWDGGAPAAAGLLLDEHTIGAWGRLTM